MRRRTGMGRGYASGPPGLRAALLVGVALSFAAAPAGWARDAIRITGSDTMLILNREWTERYGQVEPGIEFTVVGGGSERGIDALLAGEVDIAAASRKMREAELAKFESRYGDRPREVVVALDGIAFYVHTSNPVIRLTMDQLVGILTGEIQSWSQVSKINRKRIHVYSRDRHSGTRTFVSEHILKGKPFASDTVYVSSTSLVTACVQRNPRALGYGGVAHAENTRIVRLANSPDEFGFWPTKENVASGRYPASRPLHFYLNPASVDQPLQAFVDWVLSEEGQRVVSFVGYYPVSLRQPPREGSGEADASLADSARATEPSPGSTAANDAPAPAEAPDTRPTTGEVKLTPANASGFGFAITAELGRTPTANDPRPVPVSVFFGPEGEGIDTIETIELRIGESAVVPLSVQPGEALRFSLRPSVLDDAAIHLSEAGAPREGRLFVLPVPAFLEGE